MDMAVLRKLRESFCRRKLFNWNKVEETAGDTIPQPNVEDTGMTREHPLGNTPQAQHPLGNTPRWLSCSGVRTQM